jgi:polyhydroxyalkanoate synthesis regulator phasin
MQPPDADLLQDLRAIRDEIAELKWRIEQLEAQVAAMDASLFG